MTAEQKLVWSALSHNYPTRKSCSNCSNWMKVKPGCKLNAGLVCDVYYNEDVNKFYQEFISGPQKLWKWNMIND